VRWVIAHAKLSLDHGGDPRGGPDVASEAVRFGPLGQEVMDLGTLLRGEAMGRTRGDPAAQGFSASLWRLLQPVADRPLRHAQRRRDGALLPAPLGQLPRSKAAPFAQIAGWYAGRCWHTRSACSSQATFISLCWNQ